VGSSVPETQNPMDDKILASLIQILQKHANSIRTLKVLNIALTDRLRLVAERTGVSYEEFEREFQESLETVAKNGPPHDPHGIAKDIEETAGELIFLRKLAKKQLN
jgi:hypothetical protein